MSGIEVKLTGGTLIATKSTDPEYPGIDIEFIADNESDTQLSRPRVLIEESEGVLRALVWNNPDSEDYSEELDLKTLKEI